MRREWVYSKLSHAVQIPWKSKIYSALKLPDMTLGFELTFVLIMKNASFW
jgi:hypothetical protein